MTIFLWIFLSGLLMSAIALVGSLTLLLRPATLDRIVKPLVAFAAGSLLGGAFFHMLPAAAKQMGNLPRMFLWTMAGFSLFFALEQFLHWHHCHRADADCKKPLTYLILLGDGLHNFLGGLGVASVFLVDVRLGITTGHGAPLQLPIRKLVSRGSARDLFRFFRHRDSLGSTSVARGLTEPRCESNAGVWHPTSRFDLGGPRERTRYGPSRRRPARGLPLRRQVRPSRYDGASTA